MKPTRNNYRVSQWEAKEILRGTRGFTLIELLVVICIIGVLAALCVPAIAKVQEKSGNAKCTNNLRQIGAGLMTFAADNSGQFPVAGADIPYGAVGESGAPGWTEQLDSYLGTSEKDTSVFQCPSSAKVIPTNKKYSYFLGTHAAMLENGTFGAVVSQRIKYPSRYILGGDISSAMFTVDDADKDDYSQDPAFANVPAPFHGGKVNILFADGSVRAFAKFDEKEMCVDYEGAVTGY